MWWGSCRRGTLPPASPILVAGVLARVLVSAGERVVGVLLVTGSVCAPPGEAVGGGCPWGLVCWGLPSCTRGSDENFAPSLALSEPCTLLCAVVAQESLRLTLTGGWVWSGVAAPRPSLLAAVKEPRGAQPTTPNTHPRLSASTPRQHKTHRYLSNPGTHRRTEHPQATTAHTDTTENTQTHRPW